MQPLSSHLRSIASIMLVAAAVLAPTPAAAYGGLDTYELSADEVALLPEFCRQTQLINARHGSPAGYRAWTERVGPGFMHMHHYCIGIVAFVRSYRHKNTVNDRSGYLTFADQNYSYVVERVGQDFFLLPEVLYRRGQTRSRQGRTDAAIKDLDEALRKDPKHTRASYELSQALVTIGDRRRAEATLKAGLEEAPDSKLLKSALAELQSAKKK